MPERNIQFPFLFSPPGILQSPAQSGRMRTHVIQPSKKLFGKSSINATSNGRPGCNVSRGCQGCLGVSIWPCIAKLSVCLWYTKLTVWVNAARTTRGRPKKIDFFVPRPPRRVTERATKLCFFHHPHPNCTQSASYTLFILEYLILNWKPQRRASAQKKLFFLSPGPLGALRLKCLFSTGFLEDQLGIGGRASGSRQITKFFDHERRRF